MRTILLIAAAVFLLCCSSSIYAASCYFLDGNSLAGFSYLLAGFVSGSAFNRSVQWLIAIGRRQANQN